MLEQKPSILDMIFNNQSSPNVAAPPILPIPQMMPPMQTMPMMPMMPQTSIRCESLMPLPQHTPIGMAYVPYQQWEKLYDDAVAISRGTIFPSLDKPFIGEEAVRNARQR